MGELFPGYFQTSSFTNVAETFVSGKPITWDIHYEVDGLNLYNKMTAARLDKEVVVHFTDFTEVKNLQHQLETKIQELEGSNQKLQEFAHAASHDLKEPIRKISIFIELLKEQLTADLAPGSNQLLEKMRSSVMRMNGLIDDLLQYAHLTIHPVEKEMLDLNEVLNPVLEVLELEIEQKGASISMKGSLAINGYRRQLQQLFQNLISNGLKYSKADVPPLIAITSVIVKEDNKDYFLIEVQDNGIGFESEYTETIFKIFSRLHGKDEYSGTGIGLSIVKKVVENHNGFIRVESNIGEGSIFKVYLPVD